MTFRNGPEYRISKEAMKRIEVDGHLYTKEDILSLRKDVISWRNNSYQWPDSIPFTVTATHLIGFLYEVIQQYLSEEEVMEPTKEYLLFIEAVKYREDTLKEYHEIPKGRIIKKHRAMNRYLEACKNQNRKHDNLNNDEK